MFSYIFCFVLTVFANAQPNSRIIGGNYAENKKFPYMAYIKILDVNGYYSNCGGSIISDQWILTAGHCVFTKGCKVKGKVLLGSNYYTHITSGRNVYEFEESHVHPNYRRIIEPIFNIHSIYDIALLKLTKKIPQFTRDIEPVKLAYLNLPDSFSAILSGWGMETINGTLSTLLKYTEYTITKRDCGKFQPNTICPIGEGGIFCNGDSGSPLVVNGTQIGIVSNGNCTFAPRSPDYFTDVQKYLEWIQNVTKIEILSQYHYKYI